MWIPPVYGPTSSLQKIGSQRLLLDPASRPSCAPPQVGQQRASIAALLILVLVGLAGCAETFESRGTAIVNVTLIDAATGARPGQTVVFDGDRIVAVTGADADLPPVERSIDGTGKYLIPGLWDMHVHLTYDERFTDAMPELFLRHGITSVRDTGGLIDRVKPVVERMRQPGARAPRVFFSGPLLDGSAVVYDGVARPEIGIQNDSPAAASANVEALASAGVDFVKLYELVSPEVFEALVESARARDLPIAAHVPLTLLADQAGPLVDSMEHLRNVELACARDFDRLLERRTRIISAHDQRAGAELRSRLHSLQRLPAIADYDAERCRDVISSLHSTIQVPTLRLNTSALHSPFARGDWEAAIAQVPAAAKEEWTAATEAYQARAEATDPTFARWSLHLVELMHDQGVPIGAGTDTPIGYALPGYSLHTELERLVEAGLEALEALRSATRRPAEFFGLEDEMGTVAEGFRADLVLLDANPLDDITNTRKISAVISKGEVVVGGTSATTKNGS